MSFSKQSSEHKIGNSIEKCRCYSNSILSSSFHRLFFNSCQFEVLTARSISGTPVFSCLVQQSVSIIYLLPIYLLGLPPLSCTFASQLSISECPHDTFWRIFLYLLTIKEILHCSAQKYLGKYMFFLVLISTVGMYVSYILSGS